LKLVALLATAQPQGSDIEAELERLDVEVERYEFADAGGIRTAAGGARMPWFRDPDGNILSLTERA
jgi:hypothetical protein